MNWGDYVTALQTMLQMQDAPGIANLNAILPRVVDDAELRLYREPRLDFLATRTTDSTQQTTVGNRTVAIPPQFIVIEDVALITPASTQPDTVGASRLPLLRTSRAFIDLIWPNTAQTATPQPFQSYWAVFNEEGQTTAGAPTNPSIRIAPTPDATYVVQYHGTFRPTPFYTVAVFNPTTGVATNAAGTTFLSLLLPDVFLAASLVFAYGYMKNYGAAADNPQTAVSWEAHLQMLLDGASIEEARKKSLAYYAGVYPVPVVPPPQHVLAGVGGGAAPQ